MMWRAFVYGNGMVGKEDRARQAADTFLALDGKFDQNVVIQVRAVHSTAVLRQLVSFVVCFVIFTDAPNGPLSARAAVTLPIGPDSVTMLTQAVFCRGFR